MNEINLLDALADDSQKAMQTIYDEYYVLLCKIAYLRLKDRNSVNDVVQELLIEFWNRRKQLRIQKDLKSYLIKSLMYKISRSNQYQTSFIELDKSNPEAFHPVDELEIKELKDHINAVVDDLPARVKECFLLSRSNGLKHQEIAEKLEISPKTVDHHITRALKILRQKLKSSLYTVLF